MKFLLERLLKAFIYQLSAPPTLNICFYQYSKQSLKVMFLLLLFNYMYLFEGQGSNPTENYLQDSVPSFYQLLRIKLKSSGLAASAFTG